MNSKPAVPNKLRAIRQAQHVPQIELYMRSGVAPSHISFIECHDFFPTEEVRARLAAALDVEQADIWPDLPARQPDTVLAS